jgi:sialidase-1
MSMKHGLLLILLLAAVPACAGELAGQRDVFVSGEDGYDTYRIPALAVTKSGTVLAFCEGRRKNQSDSGDIDMLVKRSEDNGETWGAQQVVWDDGANTCGNPSPVLDRESGTVWLLMTWNLGSDHEQGIIARTSKDTRRVFATSSADDGRTWAAPKEITEAVKPPEWTWYATGPGAGIQMTGGAHAGRLVVPCDHIESGGDHYFSHVIFSDDHGATWRLGGNTPQHQVNECEVVELKDGALMLNMRNYDKRQHARQVALSEDGGATWTSQRFDETLVEPICQASTHRVGGCILFANPADAEKRVNMTVRVSEDEGKSWAGALTLYPGPSAYSDLAQLADGRAACLYECGERNAYERIRLVRFQVGDIPRTAKDK